MERLTERWCKGMVRIKGCSTAYPDKERKGAPMASAIARLAAYEDAMPLERARELAKAEKDGRLVVLPCKVGDAVYFPVEGRWDAATIDRIEIDSNGVRLGWVQYDVGPEVNELWDDGCFTAGDIGKTVFLTREEAEAALKKREADNEAD